MKALLFNDTSFEKHIGCNQVIKNIFDFSKKNNIKILKTFKRDAIIPKSSALHNYIKEVDLDIINGEAS